MSSHNNNNQSIKNTIQKHSNLILSKNNNKKLTNNSEILNNETLNDKNNSISNSQLNQSWDDIWTIINVRTGISDPDIFFHRINNGKLLEEQINILKKQSENRLELLKKELLIIEIELEETRYDASVTLNGHSLKEQQKDLIEKQYNVRHIRERTETSELLHQRVITGLVHLGEMLGIQPREDDSSIIDLQHDIEAVLDTLLDEREKQIQQQGQQYNNQSSSIEAYSRAMSAGNPPIGIAVSYCFLLF